MYSKRKYIFGGAILNRPCHLKRVDYGKKEWTKSHGELVFSSYSKYMFRYILQDLSKGSLQNFQTFYSEGGSPETGSSPNTR